MILKIIYRQINHRRIDYMVIRQFLSVKVDSVHSLLYGWSTL